MKVLFAGPSIYGLDLDLTGIDLRGPARRGDASAAVREGATHIGLVDGYFGWTASVWHKEILGGLSAGITILGAASIGALRAAECHSFGMVAVGEIANRYLAGTLEDDGDVALLHGPAELGYPPVTEALVDVEATLFKLVTEGLIGADERSVLRLQAATLNFRDRTLDALYAVLPPHRRAKAIAVHESHRVSLKADDARLLIDILRRGGLAKSQPDWVRNASPIWAATGL